MNKKKKKKLRKNKQPQVSQKNKKLDPVAKRTIQVISLFLALITTTIIFSAIYSHINNVLAPDPKRQQTADYLFNAMNEMVKTTNDPEAQKIYDFFQQRCYLAQPIETGYIFRKGKQILTELPDGMIGMMIVLPEDIDSVHDLPKNAINRTMYHQDKNMFYLSTSRINSISWQIMALIMFHESQHAYRNIVLGKNNQTIYDYLRSDLSSYNLETKLLEKYLGQQYSLLLNDLALQTTISLDNEKKVIIQHSINPDSYKPRLANILWSSHNLNDEAIVYWLFLTHAGLKVAQNHSDKHAQLYIIDYYINNK